MCFSAGTPKEPRKAKSPDVDVAATRARVKGGMAGFGTTQVTGGGGVTGLAPLAKRKLGT
jgi:hypothetical protein